MSESKLLKEVQIFASSLGARMLRNNCGQLQDREGRWVRYGVANPGGSDLVGWTPCVVTANMLGHTIAVFTAIEVKTPTGRPSKEQLAFLEAVRSAGGIAVLARSIDDVQEGVNGFRSSTGNGTEQT